MTDDLAAALTVVTAAVRARVEEALAAAGVGEPIWSVCLWPDDAPDQLMPITVLAATNSDYARALGAEDPVDDAWNVSLYAHTITAFAGPLETPSELAAAAVVLAHCEQAGIYDPPRWALEAAAGALMADPPDIERTEPFVVWAWNQGYELAKSLERLLPPATRAALEADGLWPDEGDELEL